MITTNYVNKKNSKVVYVSEQGAPYTTLSQAYMPSGKMQPVDLTEAAEKTVHGVVHIKSTIKGRTQTYQEYPDIFEYFFGGRPRQRQYQSQPQVGYGSGVILTKDGYIVFSEEVERALAEGKPVVAIESAATFGGMIYPGIADFAFRMRNTVREFGAVPAFTAILNGQIHIGLTEEEILYLEQRRGSIFKASARDIPILLAKKQDGVMTIAAAVQTAALAGIPVACGSGIGGAQIGAEKTMDISTDLESVARNPVMVVCSGTKPILDLSLTMEYLETQGVPVVGYKTDRMPEYMVRGSGFRLTYRMDTPEELAEIMYIKKMMNIGGGVLVVNPVPKEYELDPIRTKKAVDEAMLDVKKNNVMGKAITGYMMGRIKEYLGSESVESQKAFLINNAKLAARIADAISKQKS